MAPDTNTVESDLDRISGMIAELDEQEFLLLGLDPEPSLAAPPALRALREERSRLEEELAAVWAKRCSKC